MGINCDHGGRHKMMHLELFANGIMDTYSPCYIAFGNDAYSLLILINNYK